MDKELLEALGNVSFALESLVDAIDNKKETDDGVTKALKSGDFTDYLDAISADIKSVKVDTTKILENQETIISLSKEQEKKKLYGIEDAGSEDQKKNITEGASSIVLIAGAVLAIGSAFNIVGEVDYGSVISVSLAIALISKSFNELSDTDFTIEKALTSTGVLVAMSLGIAASSYVLSYVTPISMYQALTSIMIGGVFVALSYSMSNIFKAFDKADGSSMAKASIFMPLILPAMSLSIAASSWALGEVTPISMNQFLTSAMIGLTFAVLSYPMKTIIRSFKGIGAKEIATSAIAMPILFTSMAAAIAGSSYLINETQIVGEEKLKSALLLGGVLGGLSIVMSVPIRVLKSVSIADIAKGGLAILGISAVISGASHILGMGEYADYPDIQWALGVSASLGAFGLGMVLLGTQVANPLFWAGIPTVLAVAGVISGTSHILNTGSYDNPGLTSWAVSTALLFSTFTPIMSILGAVAVSSNIISAFGGGNPIEMANEAILNMASTIVETSKELQKGSYIGGPSKEWAEGVAISLGAFSPVYSMLMRNKIFEFLGSGGVGPDDFSRAITVVSSGIIEAAKKFKENEVAFEGGPSKEWAEGVGLAISSFAPVYAALNSQGTDFWGNTKGYSPEDMERGIMTISKGIIQAAREFSDPSVSQLFNNSNNYPTPEWGKGVGESLSAFSPVFESLSGKSWYQTGDDVINSMTKGVKAITSSLVSSAIAFSGHEYNSTTNKWEKVDGFSGIWSSYPSEEWAKNVSLSVGVFFDLFSDLNEKGMDIDDVIDSSESLKQTLVSMVVSAKVLNKYKDDLSVDLNPNYVNNLSDNILPYVSLSLKISEIQDKASGGILGFGSDDTDYVLDSTKGLIKTAKILSENRDYFDMNINPNYMSNLGKNILDYNNIIKELLNSEDVSKENIDDAFGQRVIESITNRITTLAGGYDDLASSLNRVGVAMKSLNIQSVDSLGGFTKDLIKDDNSLSNSNNTNYDRVREKKESVSVNNYNNTSSSSSSNEEMISKFNEMIDLLKKIDTSSGSLNSLITDEIGDEDAKESEENITNN